MGNIVTVLSPENPATILINNPELVVGSSWNTIFTTTQLSNTSYFSENYSIIGYPNDSPTEKPYYITRPLCPSFSNLGVATPGVGTLGNSVVDTLSVVEDTTPGSEVINMFIKTNYMDYEYNSSITSLGLLADSFGLGSVTQLLTINNGVIVKETNQTNQVSGNDITLTYLQLAYNILTTRIIVGPSNDTLESVSDIISNIDFGMASTATYSSFKFFIKNTNATDNITVLPGLGWTFVSFIIPPKTTTAFMASINYNAVTADLVVLSNMSSVP